MRSSIVFLGLLVCLCYGTQNTKIRHTDLVHEINSNPEIGWTAKSYAMFEGLAFHEAQDYCGVLSPLNDLSGTTFSDDFFTEMRRNAWRRNSRTKNNIPSSFDARNQWPQCSTIGSIRDQQECSACWAFSATEVLADRFCIHQNISVPLSPQHLVNCDTTEYGCGGGLFDNVWRYLMNHGVVSESCVPYQSTTQCTVNATSQSCVSGDQPTLYFASSGYRVGPTVEDFQNELMNNGPVQDFATYSSGIYQRSNDTTNRFVGYHAGKIIGWGVDNGVDYWIVANSWGPTWGENGFYRIRRGVDEIGIEAAAAAGMPGSIQSSVDKVQDAENQTKRIKVIEDLKDVDAVSSEDTVDSLPVFPAEFTATGGYGGGGISLPAQWFWSSTEQRQRYSIEWMTSYSTRIDYFSLDHAYSQLYDYEQETAYWYYLLFDSTVCYHYPTAKSKLGPGIPSDATMIASDVPCNVGSTQTNCSTWQKAYNNNQVHVTTVVTESNPSYPISFTQSLGMGQGAWKWTQFENTVDASKLVVPQAECLPWPGDSISTPIN